MKEAAEDFDGVHGSVTEDWGTGNLEEMEPELPVGLPDDGGGLKADGVMVSGHVKTRRNLVIREGIIRFAPVDVREEAPQHLRGMPNRIQKGSPRPEIVAEVVPGGFPVRGELAHESDDVAQLLGRELAEGAPRVV